MENVNIITDENSPAVKSDDTTYKKIITDNVNDERSEKADAEKPKTDENESPSMNGDSKMSDDNHAESNGTMEENQKNSDLSENMEKTETVSEEVKTESTDFLVASEVIDMKDEVPEVFAEEQTKTENQEPSEKEVEKEVETSQPQVEENKLSQGASEIKDEVSQVSKETSQAENPGVPDEKPSGENLVTEIETIPASSELQQVVEENPTPKIESQVPETTETSLEVKEDISEREEENLEDEVRNDGENNEESIVVEETPQEKVLEETKEEKENVQQSGEIPQEKISEETKEEKENVQQPDETPEEENEQKEENIPLTIEPNTVSQQEEVIEPIKVSQIESENTNAQKNPVDDHEIVHSSEKNLSTDEKILREVEEDIIQPVQVTPRAAAIQIMKCPEENPLTEEKKDEKVFSFGLASWFKPDRLHPRVESLIYWRDVKKSGVVFVSTLAILVAMSMFSFISVVAYLSLVVLAGTISFRVYKAVVSAVQKTTDGNPFQEILDIDLSLSSEKVQQSTGVVATHINAYIAEMRRLFCVVDIVDSMKLALLLWMLTYIGAMFNGMTVIILAFVAMFTIPKIYESNKEKIDQGLDLIKSKYVELTEKIKAAIPASPSKKEESDKDK